jgi:hypothetical protein
MEQKKIGQCEHNKRIGANYGISCQDGGQVLEGYGYGGWFGSNLKGNENCIHGENAWYTINDSEEECNYCHRVRKRDV